MNIVMIQLEILITIVIFMNYIKSGITKNLVYISFALSIISKLITTYSDKIFVLAYILFFVAILIVLKEKIICKGDEVYKPLKFIAIIVGIFALIMSIVYLKEDFNTSFLDLIGAFILISISCRDKKIESY